MRYDVCPPLFEELFSSFPETGTREEKQMKKEIITASLAALVLTGGAFTVRAEGQPVYTLDGIVVTASRTPEKKIDTNADISVVTAEEIAEKHYSDMTEAIRNIPGVNIQNYSANAQNYSANKVYINGSDNVVILVDGIRRNTNGSIGAAAGTLVNMDSIDHVEVLKGAASTLYGSDAQGGVINIITKKPTENQVKTTLRGSWGNEGKEKYTLYNEGKAGDFFWTVEAGKELQGSYKDGWGRRIINQLNAEHYDIKVGYDLGNDSSVVVNYEKYKSDYTRPSDSGLDTHEAKGKKDNDHIDLQYKAKINDRLTNQFSIYRNRTTYHDNYNYGGASGSYEWGGYTYYYGPTGCELGMKTTGISDQLTYKMSKHTIIGGFDWYKDEITKYENTSMGYTSQEIPAGSSITTTAFYVQDKIDLTDQWNITPGIRFDHNSAYGNHTSPSLSLGYKQSKDTNFYFNYKEFFVAPNLYQLHSTSYGNKDLDPQKGHTFEFGVNHNFSDSLTGTFSVFQSHAKNRIIFGSASRYENTGKVNSNGFNIGLNKKFNDHWSASLGYTYLHINALDDSSNINFDGQLPQSTLNLGVRYDSDKINATLSGRGVMNRYGKASKPIMRDYGSFWVWDLAANYKVTPEITVFGRLNNIFDQFYTDIGTSYDPQYSWYSAPGRNFEVGLQFQF